jgi:hypothetical protein
MEDFDTNEIDALNITDLIQLFNEFLYDLLQKLNQILVDEDLSYCYNMFNSIIQMNQRLIIDQFNINVLEYYDKIKEKDIDFFLRENDSVKKYGESESVVKRIFKFKSLFKQLDKKNQDMLFYYLNTLCYIGARYFTLTELEKK